MKGRWPWSTSAARAWTWPRRSQWRWRKARSTPARLATAATLTARPSWRPGDLATWRPGEGSRHAPAAPAGSAAVRQSPDTGGRAGHGWRSGRRPGGGRQMRHAEKPRRDLRTTRAVSGSRRARRWYLVRNAVPGPLRMYRSRRTAPASGSCAFIPTAGVPPVPARRARRTIPRRLGSVFTVSEPTQGDAVRTTEHPGGGQFRRVAGLPGDRGRRCVSLSKQTRGTTEPPVPRTRHGWLADH